MDEDLQYRNGISGAPNIIKAQEVMQICKEETLLGLQALLQLLQATNSKGVESDILIFGAKEFVKKKFPFPLKCGRSIVLTKMLRPFVVF